MAGLIFLWQQEDDSGGGGTSVEPGRIRRQLGLMHGLLQRPLRHVSDQAIAAFSDDNIPVYSDGSIPVMGA